jgi:nucleotidyltransferase/DNA polymerase involved in DNA repair
MSDNIFSLHSWPQAIVHIDGDAFFTSCEEAIHPELKGKPLITGGERGIVACASYAAKGLGVKRGVPLHEARKMCPDLIVLPSDYETYSLFSKRMFDIMRHFTPVVEEYSIDEAFLDITGLRRAFHNSYETIVREIKAEIERGLGITVSAGLSLTKVLAKIASKHKKPRGLTIIPGREIARYLKDLPVEKIWGIGPATTAYLNKMGVRTALEFARMPEATIRKRFSKPGVEIWQELRGESVYPVSSEEKSSYASISKTKTFSPPTSNSEYVYAHLLRNLESACIKARRYQLAPKRIIAYLKTQNFEGSSCEAKLNRPSSYPMELASLLKGMFDDLYTSGKLYRATGVVLLDLKPDTPLQLSLFEDAVKAERISKSYQAIDELNQRYGKHVVHLGASHLIEALGKGRRGEPTARDKTRLWGETKRKHLNLPILHGKV